MIAQNYLFTAVIWIALGMGNHALADAILEAEIKSHMASGELEMPLALGMESLARGLGQLECDYSTKNADLILDHLSQGMTISQISSIHLESGRPTFLEDFISRQEDFASDGPTVRVKARIIMEIDQACQKAAEDLIAGGRQ